MVMLAVSMQNTPRDKKSSMLESFGWFRITRPPMPPAATFVFSTLISPFVTQFSRVFERMIDSNSITKLYTLRRCGLLFVIVAFMFFLTTPRPSIDPIDHILIHDSARETVQSHSLTRRRYVRVLAFANDNALRTDSIAGMLTGLTVLL
jgi:hypothetical protein